MLEQSEAKLKHKMAGRTAFKHVVLPQVEYESGQFDAVLNTMVLHHIVSVDDTTQRVEDWSPIQDTFTVRMSRVTNVRLYHQDSKTILSIQVARVLKPGGVFVLNWASVEQVKALWYAHLAGGFQAKRNTHLFLEILAF